MPKGYLYNVKKIIYTGRESISPIMIFYGFSFRPVSSTNPLTKNITIFCKRKTEGVKYLRTLIAHEGAHLNDWNSNQLLACQERIKLFCDVLERLDARDQYSSCYVESINPKNKSLKKYMRAIEYWAEANEGYLSCAGNSSSISPKDREIIEDVLQKMDPYYFQKINNWRCQPH